MFYIEIRLLVCQSFGHIFFVFGVCGKLECCSKFLVIVIQHLQQGIFLGDSTIRIIYVVVEYGHNIQRRILLLEYPIISYCLRYILRSQNGVEFTVLAQFIPSVCDVGSDSLMMNRLLIQVLRQIMFYSMYSFISFLISVLHFQFIHESVVNSHFLLIIFNLLYAVYLQLRECHFFAKFIVVVCSYHVRIESQYVVVRDSVGDSVFMNHTAEYGFGHDFMFGVFFEDWCSCETEKQGSFEGVLDSYQHIAKYTTMTFIYDEYQSFTAYQINVVLRNIFSGLDIRHLLNRGYNQPVVVIRTFEFVQQDSRVLRILNRFVFSRKSTVFVQRLHTQLDTVQQEHNFVSIAGIGNELCRLETGHGLSGTGGMPHVSSTMLMSIPIGFIRYVTDFAGCKILIAAKYFQCFVLIVGNGIITD